MKKIILHGTLGENFGREWTLDIATPAEALRAIQANRPSFFAHILESAEQGVAYRFVAGEDRHLTPEELQHPTGRETLHLIPVIGGAKSGGIGLILGGALLAFATFGGSLAATSLFSIAGKAVTLGSVAFSIGTNLVLGGVAQMLTGNPEAPVNTGAGAEKQSYYFSGPVQTAGQGSAVPVGYGELLVGSIPVSGGLSADNVAGGA